MNANDARRILDPNGTFAKDDPMRLKAEGYLEALCGLEIGWLVAALEKVASKRENSFTFCAMCGHGSYASGFDHGPDCPVEDALASFSVAKSGVRRSLTDV